jgi:hypothetical protein
MVAESQTLPDPRSFLEADRRSYLEQRIFALSPLNLWITAAAIYLGLIGAYAVAAAIDGAQWIHPVAGGYALDDHARVALILTLVICVALAVQRFVRVREQTEEPGFAALAQRYLVFEHASLKRATTVGLAGGVLLVLLFRAPGVGLRDVDAGSARSVWFVAATLLLAVLFARGVELTRAGSGFMRRSMNEGLDVDLLHIDRLYGWGRVAARNALTWFAVSASALPLFISQVSPLVAAGLICACAVMGLWAFVNTMQVVHQRIRTAKDGELDTVRGEISELRSHPGAEPQTSLRLHSLLAYEARIAAVGEWPFDQSILVRLLGSTLILALPWFGQAAAGVLVEHIGRLIH